MYKFFSLNSGRNLRNITCLLFPSHDFVSVSVRFFSQDTAFYIVDARQSHNMCLNGFLSRAVGLFY